MAYTAGDLILDDHYNIFATGDAGGTATAGANVNHVWGTGFGSSGYGQGTVLTPVATGNTITATQWSTMLARINSAASHQGTAITTITSPVAGNTITAYNALSANITAIHTNRLNFTANGTDFVGSTATGTSNWNTLTQHTFSVTFASADAARYYFNAGGTIRIAFNIAGGTADAKYNEWVDLANVLAGTVEFGANTTTKVGGTGIPTTANPFASGYYQMGLTPVTVYQQFADSSPYTTNNIEVRSLRTGALGTNGDNGATFNLIVNYNDAATDSVFTNPVDTALDVMNGTVTSTLTFRPPSTTYLTNTWGTPTATFTNSQT